MKARSSKSVAKEFSSGGYLWATPEVRVSTGLKIEPDSPEEANPFVAVRIEEPPARRVLPVLRMRHVHGHVLEALLPLNVSNLRAGPSKPHP